MNTLVVYFTKFGNTRAVAETLAVTFAQAGHTRAIGIEEIATVEWDDVDLLVVGSPTHYQNLPQEMRSALEQLPRRILTGKYIVAFDTSVKMWGPVMFLTAARRLQRILWRLGGKTVVPPETFLVARDFSLYGAEEIRQDKLCDGELDRAEKWSETILTQLQAQGAIQIQYVEPA